jgi:hypothetical protein
MGMYLAHLIFAIFRVSMKFQLSTVNALSPVVLFASLVACGGGSGGESDSVNDASSGNVPLPIVAAGDFDRLRATISLAGIPELLVSGDIDSSDSVSLSVSFDTNEDGIISAGDLRLAMGIVIDAQTQQESFETALYEYVGGRFDGIAILSDVEYEIAGNQVTFVIDKSESTTLDAISTQTQVYVAAVISAGTSETTSADYLPEYNSFTQVQNVSQIFDATADYSGNNSIIDISEFRLELNKTL